MPLSTPKVIELLLNIEKVSNEVTPDEVALDQMNVIAIGQAAKMLKNGIDIPGRFDPPQTINPEVFCQEGRDQATDRVLSEELHPQRYEMMIQQQQITINQLISLLSLALNKGT